MKSILFILVAVAASFVTEASTVKTSGEEHFKISINSEPSGNGVVYIRALDRDYQACNVVLLPHQSGKLMSGWEQIFENQTFTQNSLKRYPARRSKGLVVEIRDCI